MLVSLLCELLVEVEDMERVEEGIVEARGSSSSSILLFLCLKFGLPNLHSILEPLAILYLREPSHQNFQLSLRKNAL